MKLPYIQLFPNDWLNDLNLKMCSLAAQGLWMRMCCVMTQGDPYGHLKVKGRVIPTDKLAEAVGVKVDEILPLIRELEEFDVFSRDADGAIYSRRLVRDDQKRQTCVTNGLKGGNPAIKKTKGKPLLNEGISQGLTGALSHGLSLSSSPIPSPEIKDMSTDSSDPDGSAEKSVPTPKKAKEPKSEPKFGDDARALAKMIYDDLKADDALPAAKDFFVRQAIIAEGLLQKHSLEEWQAAYTWGRAEPFHRQKMANLRYLGDVVWPQYAKRGTSPPVVGQRAQKGGNVFLRREKMQNYDHVFKKFDD